MTRVSDGDTISLSGIGKVRLIGIDTPEVYGGTECFGHEASAYTKRLLPDGTRVRYRLGLEERDRYGRALAYVWLRDGRLVNGLIVLGGYGTPLTVPPNVDYADAFRRAGRIARRRGRGLWGGACGEDPNPGRKPCSDFATQEEAQAYFEGPGRDQFASHDGDGDGRVCESLPPR